MDKLLMLDKILKNDKLLYSEGVIRIGNDPYFSLDKVRKIVTKIIKQDGKGNFKNLPISMRIGMIVVFEEYIQRKLKHRDEYDFEFIYKIAYSRFKLRSRNKKRFNSSLPEVHPEDPCAFYEDNNWSKGQYKRAVNRILTNSSWLIEFQEAEESLQEIYNEVNLC